jgi:hypothetical protein
MVHMTPDELPKLPVEQLAQFLLGCAREDPALLARSSTLPIGAVAPSKRPGLPLGDDPLDILLMLKPGAPGTRSGPELEELVSIAVACARRAEDALQHAREVSRMARRRLSMVAALTAVALAAGVGAFVLDRNTAAADPRRTEVASTVQSVSDLQKETVAQLAEVRSSVAAIRDSANSAQPAAVQPAAVQPVAVQPVTAQPSGAEPVVRTVPPVDEPGPVEVASAEEAPAPAQAPDPAPVRAAVAPQPQANVPRTRLHHAHYAAYPYRRPVWQPAPQPTLPVIMAQVAADFRRNLNAIFH